MPDLLVICNITPEMKTQLESVFELQLVKDLDDPAEWLAAHGAEIDYVLTDGHLGIGKDMLDKLPNLRAVSSYGVGYDAVDTGEAVRRGIPVSHTPDVLNAEVSTTALMLMIACLRNFPAEVAHARSGKWETEGNLPLSHTADGRTVGILGLGRIGKNLAAKLVPFGTRILYTGRNRQDVPYEFIGDLEEMAREADVLVSIVPGGAATHHLVNAAVLDALGPDGILVNVGRGSVVDETALIKALQEGRLGGAGLDVFEDEPRIPEALRTMPNVVVTPHIGSATVETRAAMGKLAVDNLLRHKRDGAMLTPIPECADLVPRA